MLALSLFLAVLCGCSTDPVTRYYEISVLAPSSREERPASELVIAEIRVPDALARTEMVVQKTPHEVEVLDDHRWLSPLDEQLRKAIRSDLGASLPGFWVNQSRSFDGQLKRYTLRIEIQQLTVSRSGDKAILVAAWSIGVDSIAPSRYGRADIEVPVSGPGYEGVAPAVSLAVERLSAQISASLRVE